MGRGGGSYDRVLGRLAAPRPLVVALLHDGDLVDEVPAEPHDRPVDGALTPGGGFTRFAPASLLKPGPEWTK
jgi:5-formyltetrahydrofolate cyclo-ligase